MGARLLVLQSSEIGSNEERTGGCRMLIDDEAMTELRQGSDVAWLAFANSLRARWGRRTVQAVGQRDTDDILQEVFVRIFSHLDHVTDVSHLERLVGRIWHQRIVDWYRQRSREVLRGPRPVPPSDDRPASTVCEVADADLGIGVGRQVISEELRGTLERSTLLTAEQRLIVALHVMDELTFSAIADLLKHDVKTIETWYRRAIEILAQQLALDAYRERVAEFEAVLSERQKQALNHLLGGLPIRKTAKALGLRVPELGRLLAPAWEVLGRAAKADWLGGLQ